VSPLNGRTAIRVDGRGWGFNSGTKGLRREDEMLFFKMPSSLYLFIFFPSDWTGVCAEHVQ